MLAAPPSPLTHPAASCLPRAALLLAALLLLPACRDDEGDALGVTGSGGSPPGPPMGGNGGSTPPGTGAVAGSAPAGGAGGQGNPLANRDAASAPAPRPRDAASDGPPPDPASFNCPDVPTAYVFDFVDPHTRLSGQAPQLLAQAGFKVEALPLDRDPRELRGLIFFSSFASESPDYRAYVSKNAVALYTFVDAANVLVQMTQADQTEPTPPFLPNAQSARRHDFDVGKLVALDRHQPLLAGVPLDAEGALAWQFPNLGWETFAAQRGFEVVLGSDGEGRNPALLEGAYSQGRFVLSAIPADKPIGLSPERDQFNSAFFKNLFDYTQKVCRRQAHQVNVSPSPSRPGLGDGSFMLAVLPDTQYYSLAFPGIFLAQTSWIVANAARLNIPYVLHLGDIVDQNTPLEWQRAAETMFLLEDIVPYALATGNHDFGPSGGSTTRDTLLNDFFSYERTARWPTFGGAYQPGQLENTFHLFEAGGRKFIVIVLEWAPRNEAVAWADGVMAAHPDRQGILITHAYLNNNDFRYDYLDTTRDQAFNPHHYGTPGPVNDGEELWQKLVRKHRFVMTLNGHVLGDGTGYLASVTDTGTTCHQMLSNYQFRNLGGEGYMRLLEFLPDGTTVRIHTYSPLYDSFLNEPDQSFTIKLDPM